MTRRIVFLAATIALANVSAHAAEPALTNDAEKTIYSMGLSISQTLAPFALSEDEIEILKMGIADGVLGRKFKADPQAYLSKAQDLAAERMSKVSASESKASGEWLGGIEKNEKGIEKFPSGLLYKEVKAGKGEHPKPTSQVKVNYHGTLRDGTVFDSSIERGKPLDISLDQVIPCWTEAVQKMAPGGKAKIWCPAAIAYQDRGAGAIKPGAAISFDVELLEVSAAKAPAMTTLPKAGAKDAAPKPEAAPAEEKKGAGAEAPTSGKVELPAE